MTTISTNTPLSPTDKANPGPFERAVMRANGLGLLAASLILWIVPMLDRVPEMALMKLGVSCFMALSGLGLVLAARKPRRR